MEGGERRGSTLEGTAVDQLPLRSSSFGRPSGARTCGSSKRSGRERRRGNEGALCEAFIVRQLNTSPSGTRPHFSVPFYLQTSEPSHVIAMRTSSLMGGRGEPTLLVDRTLLTFSKDPPFLALEGEDPVSSPRGHSRKTSTLRRAQLSRATALPPL